ncbi:MAG: hypothetical protein KC933_39900 [Myxococcales bacterium]|nr:hypothetical protein [Myxococcales bacterium]MCB9671555.1 hypothetical protein [Alphaproteobacteria bacterium]MCB9691855.1 hypothetical protein [Alphaproteobacteria bacterium]
MYDKTDPIARGFYEQLTAQGFTYEQIVDLASLLLALVVRDRKAERVPALAGR